MKIFLKHLFVTLCFYAIVGFFCGFTSYFALGTLIALFIYDILNYVGILPVRETNIFKKNWSMFLVVIASLICYFTGTVSIWWPLGCFVITLIVLIFDYRKNHGFRIIKEKE